MWFGIHVKAAGTAAVRIATLRGRYSPGGCLVYKPNIMRFWYEMQ
jgi:hypothetical protein